MKNFYKGQKIVCINSKKVLYDVGGLQESHIYTVKGVNLDVNGVTLEEIESKGYEGAYITDRFVTLEDYLSTPLDKLLSKMDVNDIISDNGLDITFETNVSMGIELNRIGTFCTVRARDTNKLLAVSSAYCGENDEFDPKFGYRLALKRALNELTNNYGLTKENRTLIWKNSNLA